MLNLFKKFQPITTQLIFLAVAVGQLVRFQVFSGAKIGLTVVDVVTILLTLGLLIVGVRRGQLGYWFKELWQHPVWRWFGIFLLFALLSLVLQFGRYPHHDLLVAFSYWGRLTLIYGLAALLQVAGFLGNREQITKQFLFWAGVLLFVGYLQLIFIGNFDFMARFGWDPHVGRMLSTFFDPNYFGAFLVLVMAVLASRFRRGDRQVGSTILFILAWLGLYLTYSRSAWITGAIAVPLALWPKSWRWSLVVLVLFIALAFLPGRLGSRFQFGATIFSKGVLSSQIKGKNTTVNDIASQGADASGAARILTFRNGLKLVSGNVLTGVGYNAYGYALVKNGLATEASLGSRSGYFSDSSLLNILVTTGVIGLIIYLTAFSRVLAGLYQGWRSGSSLSTALFGFTIAWLLGSFFNNTLLYVFILLPWLILWGANETRSG